MARFSVIIPVKNGERHIHRCLESILSQTYNDYEIIVILNGCSDDSLPILQRFADNDERIRIISTDVSGVSNARNLGLEIANGEIVTFVDIDDYVAPNYFESIESSFLSYPDADGVVFNYFRVNHLTKECRCKLPEMQIISGEKAASLFFDGQLNIHGYCWNKAIKNAKLKGNRFDTDLFMGEDLDFMSRLFYQFKEVVINHDCLYYYCFSSDSATENTIENGKRFSKLVKLSPHSENLVLCNYKLFKAFFSIEGPDGCIAKAAFISYSYVLSMFYFSAFVVNNKTIIDSKYRQFKDMLSVFKQYYSKSYRKKYYKTKIIAILTSSCLFRIPAIVISKFI